MSLIEQLKEFDIADDTSVSFTWSGGTDIMHYTDDWYDSAYSETGVIYALAEAVTQGVFYENGNEILDEMRDEELLGAYERNDSGFTDFVAEVIEENLWDYCWIDRDVTKYDHKRGFVNLSFEMSAPWGILKNSSEYLDSSWSATAQTKKGTHVSVGD